MTRKKLIKKIYKSYKKSLNKLNKNFNDSNNGILYFIEYLKYLRDIGIASARAADFTEDILLLSLCFAIDEYTECSTCLLDYFNIVNGVPVQKDDSISAEDATKSYSNTYNKHVTNFLVTVKNNITNWVSTYGGKI